MAFLGSSTKRPLPYDEKENDQIDRSNGDVKKTKIMPDDRIKIREKIIEEFRNRGLTVPTQLIGKNLDYCCIDCKC